MSSILWIEYLPKSSAASQKIWVSVVRSNMRRLFGQPLQIPIAHGLSQFEHMALFASFCCQLKFVVVRIFFAHLPAVRELFHEVVVLLLTLPQRFGLQGLQLKMTFGLHCLPRRMLFPQIVEDMMYYEPYSVLNLNLTVLNPISDSILHRSKGKTQILNAFSRMVYRF